MNKVLLLGLLLQVTCISFAQTTGIRFNTSFSDTKRAQGAIGAGLYLNVNDFSKKIALSFSIDYYRNIRPFIKEGIQTYFSEATFHFNPNYILTI
ncbi:MAG: hypothetical protein ABIO46_05340 [Chitinophagales bacterium]